MNTPHLRVITPGLLTTLQDLGRWGFQDRGVPVAGALDPIALRLANALVGNPPAMAGLEICALGPTLAVEAESLRLAFCGGAPLLHRPGAAPERLAGGRSHLLRRGDQLAIGTLDEGVGAGVLAIAGGFAVAPVMGSWSTYRRARLGPLGGGPLQAGQSLPLALERAPAGSERALPHAFEYGAGPIRVVLGPQDAAFTAEALALFLSARYRVGRSSDRMGMRLEGPRLTHRQTADIASEGLAHGAIQVPGDGLPIVLLADRQTVGGYAKIATVASVDLPRLGRMLPGADMAFQAVSVEAAEALRRDQEGRLRGLIAAIAAPKPTGGIDIEALYTNNLISGMVMSGEADEDDPPY
ncbi:5-oxoprolinase subunit C family protein [Rhodospirillum rubrum]|uniref:Allophanate hydrolase subunit 2 n=1 Tax=Rhodospirillum rubrum (strain ATCC 11170 / ATH 1.1.1 / DSM 467 / LMG 4362 / NCIMB 8255 / S1) TaxID=269796 RepID=Q2RU89_RHORT|nr:biotin-dependent carboxyltransferase family protein [Rhodospirillum rubrum]ABC22306.1 Allophanate hydrolase subunit 2 [Rhodospirillum rubrum ATCC 11170]AEO48025.1 allophanate hydrolase subunit 2 [Rhodospirillum rubrum F11]MBK5953874.1 allophanate hydrolase [Rhodospirillum rubrum]QXG81948.1 biotin-dependent carboxyltransferase family protein [Rhodospirillum rubrum]HAQ00948.1 allophanate hydrolase [Rhodospirillum rubrum]